jgi:excisionase family DNA binding protein
MSTTDSPRFYSVRDAARVLGISAETLYRAIKADQFPAVKIMGRTIVPAIAIDEIIDGAVKRGGLVDAADFVVMQLNRSGGRKAL